MHWDLLRTSVEALTSFLLFHEHRRLSRVARLCRKHDIKSTWSFTLSLCILTLSILFMAFFFADMGRLFSGVERQQQVVAERSNGNVTRRAFVEEVLNGDTIRISSGETVVYKGIDAPEFSGGRSWLSESSFAATEFNRNLVEGKQVTLELAPPYRDRYSRIPAYVYVDGVMVNAELVRRGMAMAVNYSSSGQHDPRLSRLQQRAIELRLGIWKHALSPGEAQQRPVIGNKRTRIYHLPGGRYYHVVSPKNRVYFPDEEDARLAGYRRSKS